MTARTQTPTRSFRELIHRVLVVIGAVVLSLLFFLVLPLMQSISKPPEQNQVPGGGEVAIPPPPPPTEPEEPEEDEEIEEPPPPELAEEPQPLDLTQLELALNPGLGGGTVPGVTIKIENVMAQGGDVDSLFDVSNLDTPPRATYQVSPVMNDRMRRAGGGTVYVIFIVDKDGRVVEPRIQRSPDPVYNQAVLTAIRQWRFEPGKSGGKPVRSRTRLPFKFPKGR